MKYYINNSQNFNALRYVIISPVKDEEKYIEYTLKSIIAQKVKPVIWIIVDDGSKDNTAAIVGKYQKKYPYIVLVRNPNAGKRHPGVGVIRAFNYGYQYVREYQYDLIVKLDCDLSFEKDYFEKLLEKFTTNKRLGICSGIYQEKKHRNLWLEIKMPSYHAAGACKVVRKECFKDINGFIPAEGWDTVDEIRAIRKRWETRHFKDLRMKHYKIEGTGIGQINTSKMHGKIFHITGGHWLFFILKMFHRFTIKPYGLNGVAMALGYFTSVLNRKQKIVSKEEARCYKLLLLHRLKQRVTKII